MKIQYLKARYIVVSSLLVLLGLFIQGCAAQSNSGVPQQNFQAAQSQQCANTRGVEALYWDYSNGVIRVDYPETLLIAPFTNAIPFIHPAQPLYNFVYPTNWQAETLFDQATQLTGVNVIRQDNQAVWRRLNLTMPQAMTAQNVLDIEVPQMLNTIGNPQNVETVCFFSAPDGSSASALLRAGNFTANINAQVFSMPGVFSAVTSLIFAQVVVAPTTEYDQVAVDVFFPITGQLMLGGGSDPECSDGIDNDGDNKVDYPADDSCGSQDDPSEAR